MHEMVLHYPYGCLRKTTRWIRETKREIIILPAKSIVSTIPKSFYLQYIAKAEIQNQRRYKKKQLVFHSIDEENRII